MKRIVIRLMFAVTCMSPVWVCAQQTTPDAGASRDTSSMPGDTANAPGYGGSVNGSQQGEPAHHAFGHFRRDGSNMSAGSNCVGPVSYCTIFFGS
jgi:hypothetical protein